MQGNEDKIKEIDTGISMYQNE